MRVIVVSWVSTPAYEITKKWGERKAPKTLKEMSYLEFTHISHSIPFF